MIPCRTKQVSVVIGGAPPDRRTVPEVWKLCGDRTAGAAQRAAQPADEPAVCTTPPSCGSHRPPALGNTDPVTGKIVLSVKRTVPTARAFVRRFYPAPGSRTGPDRPTLIHYAGKFWRWLGVDKNYWAPVEDGELCRQLSGWLHDALVYVKVKGGAGEHRDTRLTSFPCNPATISQALTAVGFERFQGSDEQMPMWLGGGQDRCDPREILSFYGGNLHIPTGEVLASTPALFAPGALEFAYAAHAPVPVRWLEFLDELFGTDVDAVELLQDFMGYLLTPDTRMQKMLTIIGPKRSGKGTIGRVIHGLLGAWNVAAITPSSLCGSFGFAGLMGKSCAIIADAKFKSHGVGVAIERMLNITGEDLVELNAKHQAQVSLRLPTRLVMLGSEEPTLSEPSGALISRMLLLRLTESFIGCEDLGLEQKLRAELPGILLWALEGWKRLNTRGMFIEPVSAEETKQELADLASPLSKFIREGYDLGDGLRMSSDELFDAWNAEEHTNGQWKFMTKSQFGAQLRAIAPKVRSTKNGTTGVRYYTGVARR